MLDSKLIYNNSLNVIKGLKPAAVFENFLKISQVPRPSKKEVKMIAFIKNWAMERNIDCYQDKCGNSLLRIPASKGCENVPCICLQGHIDMVCEKLKEKEIDFENDPIELTIFEDENKEKWLKANGTTLGADNGIAIATCMTIAEDKNLVHGPLEMLFTMDEETGLTGAFNFEEKILKSKLLLNLDSEDKGIYTIGCAGGVDTGADWCIDTIKIPNDGFVLFTLEVSGLFGGHSGVDIHKGKANGIKLMGRLLKKLKCNKVEYYVKSINGGTKRNAIPREVATIGYIRPNDISKAKNIFEEFKSEVLLEYKKNDGGVKIEFKSVEEKEKIIEVFSCDFLGKIINTIFACPHGVYSFSPDIPELVETSTNLAIIETKKEGILEMYTSQRSSIEAAKKNIQNIVMSVFKLAGAKIITSDGYPGWAPDVHSNLLKVSKEVHKEMFGAYPKVEAIHAGLECGILIAKYPGMEALSFGPTIQNPHTPSEKMKISDIPDFYELTKGILKKYTQL